MQSRVGHTWTFKTGVITQLYRTTLGTERRSKESLSLLQPKLPPFQELGPRNLSCSHGDHVRSELLNVDEVETTFRKVPHEEEKRQFGRVG